MARIAEVWRKSEFSKESLANIGSIAHMMLARSIVTTPSFFVSTSLVNRYGVLIVFSNQGQKYLIRNGFFSEFFSQ
jgi:hypothetical protein